MYKLTDISNLIIAALENEYAGSLKREFDDSLVSRSHIDGFRKGKAPLNDFADDMFYLGNT